MRCPDVLQSDCQANIVATFNSIISLLLCHRVMKFLCCHKVTKNKVYVENLGDPNFSVLFRIT